MIIIYSPTVQSIKTHKYLLHLLWDRRTGLGDCVNKGRGYRTARVGQGGGETRGHAVETFNYISVRDEVVSMETEIGTIRNPSRCDAFPSSLEEPHAAHTPTHTRASFSLCVFTLVLPLFHYGGAIFITLHTAGSPGCKL